MLGPLPLNVLPLTPCYGFVTLVSHRQSPGQTIGRQLLGTAYTALSLLA